MSSPVTLTNSNPSSSNILTVNFTTILTFESTTNYFTIDSQFITIDGSNGANTSRQVNINNITNYPGLVSNANYTNVIIKFININAPSPSTLADSGGWIGQQGFGRSISNEILKVMEL